MVGPVAGTFGVVVAAGRVQAASLLGHGAAVPAAAVTRLVALRPGPAPRTADLPGLGSLSLPTVFERFVRAEDSTRYDGLVGVGLGLSVVRQIVQAHAGSVSLANSPAGTTVLLRLPLAGEQPTAPDHGCRGRRYSCSRSTSLRPVMSSSARASSVLPAA